MTLHLKKFINVTLCFTLALFLVSGTSSLLQADTEEVIKKSFNVKQGGTLELESDLGSVHVSESGGDTLTVEVIKKVGTSNEDKAQRVFDDFVLDFEHNGGDLRIEGDFKRNNSVFSWVSGKRLKVRYNITVPKRYNLQMHTKGGSISVSEIEGDVKAKTSGGSLTFDYVKGTVRGRTSGGSIKLEGCSGNADVNTSGGSIRIGKVKGEVKAHTSGGNIRVQEVMGTINATTSGGSVSATISKQPTADCKLTTSGGSVTVHLAEGIKVDVDAKTSGGRVHTDFPVTVKGELSKRKLHAKINGGGPELYLKTSGGSIRIKKID